MPRAHLRFALTLCMLLGATVLGPSTTHAASFAAVGAGADHTCAIRPGGSVYCWGAGRLGQLGVIGASRARTPLAVIGSYTAIQVSSGDGYWCELIVGSKVRCTGSNVRGQLGTGVLSLARYPQDVVGLPPATDVEVGRTTSCAIAGAGLYCWGDGARGQLGDGQLVFAPAPRPQAIPGVGPPLDVAVGDSHVCVVAEDRRVLCWGDTTEGKLGNPLESAITRPGEPVTGFTDAASVTAGDRHTCALRLDRRVWCWGNNTLGQLGAGPIQDSRVPVPVQGLSGVSLVDASSSTTCAVRGDGTVWCWGEGRAGELGNGRRRSSNVPVQVQGVSDAITLSVGAIHACAITRQFTTLCWGRNQFGQLGSGGRVGTSGIETTAQVVQDAVRGTARFLPTPLAERGRTSRGGRVDLRMLRLTRRGSRCPTKADVTIRARGREIVRTTRDIEPVDGGCAITGQLALPPRTQRAFTVVIVVRGTSMKTRKVKLRPQRSS